MSILSGKKVSRILVVDDLHDIADSYVFWLTELGYECMSATTSELACHHVRTTGGFDLILHDLNMPCGGARRTLREVQDIPVVVVSSQFPNLRLEAELTGAGALMCRRKESDLSYLAPLIEEALARLDSCMPR